MVIRVDGVLLEFFFAREIPGVLPEHDFIEITERGLAVDIIRDEPSPIVIPTVAGGPLTEPFEFTRRVAPIIPTVSAAPFPLILEVDLSKSVELLRVAELF